MSWFLESSHTATLQITLPPPWQRVHMDNALNEIISPRVAEQLTADLGVEAAVEVERAILAGLAVGVEQRIVLSAIRARPDQEALDYMTLAFPPNRTDDDTPDAANPGGAHISGRQREGPNDGTRTSAPDTPMMFPSRVQSVAFVPPKKRVALLTLLSTQPGVEPALRQDAGTIAASMYLTNSSDQLSTLAAETAS